MMTLQHLWEILKHAAPLALGILVPLAIAMIAWMRKEMFNWVHVAVYHVEEGENQIKSIKIRTIGNVLVSDLMMHNHWATWLIYWKVRNATEQDPILHFSADTAFRIRNLCRGFVSGLFQEGALAQAMGLEVKSEWFVITLIRDETQRGDRRVGLVVIPRSLMQCGSAFSNDTMQEWKLESPHHIKKLQLLRTLQSRYIARDPIPSVFLEIELCVIP